MELRFLGADGAITASRYLVDADGRRIMATASRCHSCRKRSAVIPMHVRPEVCRREDSLLAVFVAAERG